MNLRFLFLVFFVLSVSVAGQPVPEDSGVKIISAPPLKVSEEVGKAGIGGKMVVGLTVDKTGEARDLSAMAGPMWPCGSTPTKELGDLWAAVIQNVEASRFSPAIKHGEQVPSAITLTIDLDKILQQTTGKQEPAEGEKIPKLLRGGVVNGRAVSLPKPPYPTAARRSHVSGTVSIQVLIDEQGNVIRAGALSGHPLLQTESRLAACLSKFSPTKIEGHPVKVSGIITYGFVSP